MTIVTIDVSVSSVIITSIAVAVSLVMRMTVNVDMA
jgi:hypothetical protein